MKKIITLLVLLLIMGIGCSFNKITTKKLTPPTTTKTTTTTPTVNQKLVTPANTPAEKYCQSQGNELILRYNSETNSGEAICRFPNTEECGVAAFFEGSCKANSGSEPYLPVAKIVTSTICATSDPQVCGIDSRTYANHCSAEREGILIKHTGSCLTSATSTPAINTNQTNTVKSITATTEKITTPEPIPVAPINTDWLSLIKAIITSQPAKAPSAYISKCKAEQTVYLQSEGCASCLSNLYTETGSFICNPSNDIGHICPTTFDKKTCVVIWRDNR